MRSVWLNFELTLIVYNDMFGKNAAELLNEYISRFQQVSLLEWRQRGVMNKLRENVAQLLSPLPKAGYLLNTNSFYEQPHNSATRYSHYIHQAAPI